MLTGRHYYFLPLVHLRSSQHPAPKKKPTSALRLNTMPKFQPNTASSTTSYRSSSRGWAPELTLKLLDHCNTIGGRYQYRQDSGLWPAPSLQDLKDEGTYLTCSLSTSLCCCLCFEPREHVENTDHNERQTNKQTKMMVGRIHGQFNAF